ncbi:hypothetical protein AB406_1629 [Riemerella anatipestifer]|uniref:Uncharacterized protein n=1 Tax=Riemerella anatipestifer TaxID=34085 RepID=A0A1S7DTX8_RIEAN|nr:hypothetical protein AB406_1629 [Riemerella anatipestifer]
MKMKISIITNKATRYLQKNTTSKEATAAKVAVNIAHTDMTRKLTHL